MAARLNTVWMGKKLLKPEKYQDIIISSLQFPVENKRVKVNGFVPIAIGMDNRRLTGREFWERNALSTELGTLEMLKQKFRVNSL